MSWTSTAASVVVPTGLFSRRPGGVRLIGSAFREDACLDAAQSVQPAGDVLTPVDPR